MTRREERGAERTSDLPFSSFRPFSFLSFGVLGVLVVTAVDLPGRYSPFARLARSASFCNASIGESALASTARSSSSTC